MRFTPEQSRQFMARALALAENGLYTTTPNPRVGCVIVNDDGIILGEGWTQPAGQDHAEIQALKRAREAGHSVAGATAFVTLEPCAHFGRTPPCCNALIEARLGCVVAAMEDPNPLVAGKGLARLREAGIAVEAGVQADAARVLNEGFVSRMTRGTPWVRLKIAASLDGKVALNNGQSQWITGEAARADGHHWRARSCAVLTGIGTVLADNPRLNVRAVQTPRQPLKVVVDALLVTPPDALLFDDGKTLIATSSTDAARIARLEARGAQILHLPGAQGRVDLAALMRELGKRGVNEVLVEAGPRLNAALIDAACADALLLYLAPALLGHAAQGIAALPEMTSLTDRRPLVFDEVTRVGEDLRILARLRA